MCRLFGLSAGHHRVTASFWLLGAPDSLEHQSHRNVDGAGIGYFDEAGAPVLDKQPEPAFEDSAFARAAKDASSTTFVAHVRKASAGGLTTANTHPFTMASRIMAHNGGFGDLDRLDAELGQYRQLVHGDTDSERYFALVTKRTDERDGDVAAGIADAARWIADSLPVFSLNLVLATADELWALRYPETHELHVLERPPGDELHARSTTSSFHAPDLERTPSVVVASEALDGEEGWRELRPGELVHVDSDLRVNTDRVL